MLLQGVRWRAEVRVELASLEIIQDIADDTKVLLRRVLPPRCLTFLERHHEHHLAIGRLLADTLELQEADLLSAVLELQLVSFRLAQVLRVDASHNLQHL